MKTLIDADSACTLWRTYIEPSLGKKAAKLFERRTRKPTFHCLDEVIKPSLYMPGTGTYLPVADRPNVCGRNHDLAKAIAELSEDADVALQSMSLFANTLRIAEPEVADDGSVTYEKPSQRVRVGPHHIFTYEYDVPEVDHLRRQVEWVLPRKNPLECPMGDFYKECSTFSDFHGICVVYSGGKSLHAHVIFETAQIGELIANRASVDLREGFMAHWDRLCALLLRYVDAGGHSPDRSLRCPEQYRRLPGGTRKIVEDGHLLGMPKGTEVPQLVLWEKFRDRASGDELPMFFTPDAFAPRPQKEEFKPRPFKPSRVGRMEPDEHAFCTAQLQRLYPDWPRFACLDWQGSRYVAKFYNSASDRTPSSFMREDFSTVCLTGRDAHISPPEPLPMPLGDMLGTWCAQLRGKALTERCAASRTDDRLQKLEAMFEATVQDKPSAYAAMDTFFNGTISHYALLAVVGPEGVGKTTTLFRRHHLSMRRFQLNGESGRGMYAFADYAAATEKCASFNTEVASEDYVGVVLPSFSRAYSEACRFLGLRAIEHLDAAYDDHPDKLSAIRDKQPNVAAYLQKQHEDLWASIGVRTPAFFVVHDTMHVWTKSCLTRLMWAPSFWRTIDDKDQTERLALLRQEMTLGLAVHDEVKFKHIVAMQPKAAVDYVRRLKQSEPEIWFGADRKLADCRSSFARFTARNGALRLLHKSEDATFADVLDIEKFEDRCAEDIRTFDSGEYVKQQRPSKDDEEEYEDIYERCHGVEWKVAQRDWWDGLACQTILLTTERVPTAVINATVSDWVIVDLRTPLMPRQAVDVHARRGITSNKLPAFCLEQHQLQPDRYIVSNKAVLEDRSPIPMSMPHVRARGSNELIGKDVMQTMTFLPPEQYERLQVLNAWTGRSDLVGLHHIDEFNQTAGRNLGFRWREGIAHQLYINRRLFRLLGTSTALGHVRYPWQIVLDKHRRSALVTSSSSKTVQ